MSVHWVRMTVMPVLSAWTPLEASLVPAAQDTLGMEKLAIVRRCIALLQTLIDTYYVSR